MAHVPRQQYSIFRAFSSAEFRRLDSSNEESRLPVPTLPPLPVWLQPTRIMTYCSSLFIRILSAPTTALSLMRRSYKSIYKRYYRIAPSLNIPLEEEKMRTAFKRIQALQEYQLMLPIIQAKELLKRGSEDEKAFNYFKEYLSQGTILGETTELLRRVQLNQSCQALLALVNSEDVFYYQMLHKIEQAFNEHKIRLRIGQRLGKAMLRAESEEDPRLIESRQKVLDQHHLLSQQLEVAHTKLKAELYPKLSEILAATQPIADYQAVLEKTARLENFAGRILILEKDESILGKNKLVAVRSIFIQCQSGQYRLYHPKEGFYVYSHKERFFLALRELILDLSSSQIQFSLL